MKLSMKLFVKANGFVRLLYAKFVTTFHIQSG